MSELTDDEMISMLIEWVNRVCPESNYKDELGKTDQLSWNRDSYNLFCEEFGYTPRDGEHPLITAQREDLRMFLYIEQRKRTNLRNLKDEKKVKEIVHDVEACKNTVSSWI